jgi:hypothetical protein
MPDIRVVSEQSDEDMKRREAEARLAAPLRQLAANILRIVAGAGKAYLLPRQIDAFVDAAIAYQNAFGRRPPDFKIGQILDCDIAELDHKPDLNNESEERRQQTFEDGTWEEDAAMMEIRRGSIRMAAAMLVGQTVQERNAENTLFDGIRRLEEFRHKRRQARQQQLKITQAGRRTRRKASPSSKGPIEL